MVYGLITMVYYISYDMVWLAHKPKTLSHVVNQFCGMVYYHYYVASYYFDTYCF